MTFTKAAGLLIAAAIGLTSPIPAYAACHFTTGAAIMCTEAENAAVAFRRFGTDASLTEPTYVKLVLGQSFCYLVSRNGPTNVRIREMTRGKIALIDGFVEVVLVVVDFPHQPSVFVAADYLSGTCEKWVPLTGTIPGH